MAQLQQKESSAESVPARSQPDQLSLFLKIVGFVSQLNPGNFLKHLYIAPIFSMDHQERSRKQSQSGGIERFVQIIK